MDISSTEGCSADRAGSHRGLERVGSEPVAQLDEWHLRAQPERVLGYRAHGLGRVVADQIQPVADHDERLQLGADPVPSEFEVADGVAPSEEVRTQVLQVGWKV